MFDYLGRDVVWCTGELRQGALFCHCSQPKIYQSDLIIVRHNYIFRLDVAMNNVEGVTVVNRLKELFHVKRGLPLTELVNRIRSDLVEKRLALSQLHHQVDVFHIVVCLEVVNNVGMVKCVEQTDLVRNVFEAVVQFFFIHDFDCDFHLCIEIIVRSVNSTERANAKHLC